MGRMLGAARAQRGETTGVTAVFRTGPPQVIAKPKLSHPGCRMPVGPSVVTTPTGEPHPASPCTVSVSVVKLDEGRGSWLMTGRRGRCRRPWGA
jgi:hypothetical protein